MITHWLSYWAKQTPKKYFINNLTYQEVYQGSQKQAEQWKDELESSSRIALISENSTAMLLAIFALLYLDKEILLLNPSLTESELKTQVDDLDIKQIVLSAQKFERFSKDTHFSCLKPPHSLSHFPALPTAEIQAPLEPEKIAFIMNTSATTGHFKSVPIRQKMIDSHVKASAKTLGVQADDNWLLVTPLFHVSGLSVIMRSLFNGTRVTLLEKFDEAEVLRLVSTDNITMISLVPTMLKRLIHALEVHHLRVILLGGEFIPQALIHEAIQKKLPIYKTYGMTETFSQSVTFSLLEHLDKQEAVGQVLPSVHIQIKNQDSNGIGDIWLHSPMLMSAYLNQEALENGFETGDIGYLDKDNFLYILNRRKDIIISGGENIYPKEIENLVYAIPGIDECALIPRANATWGQVPVLYYSSKDPVITDKKILEHLDGKVAKYKLPKAVIFRSELPKNASGKIVRKDLQ